MHSWKKQAIELGDEANKIIEERNAAISVTHNLKEKIENMRIQLNQTETEKQNYKKAIDRLFSAVKAGYWVEFYKSEGESGEEYFVELRKDSIYAGEPIYINDMFIYNEIINAIDNAMEKAENKRDKVLGDIVREKLSKGD